MNNRQKVIDLKPQLLNELTQNILPFWMEKAVNPAGGFYAARLNDLTLREDVPISAIYVSRILWTFSAVYRKLGQQQYLETAQRAFDFLCTVFWDPTFGGVYWSVDRTGQPVMDRKHHYAQAFTLYGLSEFYRVSHNPTAFQMIQDLLGLLEKHAYDPIYGGYYESSDRQWMLLEDSRLSDRDLNSPKSMNTLLHLLEAYTNLRRILPNDLVNQQQEALITVFLEKIVNPQTGHLKLFFDEQWQSLTEEISYGHDIEASWLMWEAAEVSGREDLKRKTKQVALAMADAVFQRGLDPHGFIHYDGTKQGPKTNEPISWWPQVEGMVGFMNAYQLSGETRFLQPVLDLWQFINQNLIDKTYGDWIKILNPDFTPDQSAFKLGPWEGPYHHSRAMLEMIDRIQML